MLSFLVRPHTVSSQISWGSCLALGEFAPERTAAINHFLLTVEWCDKDIFKDLQMRLQQRKLNNYQRLATVPKMTARDSLGDGWICLWSGMLCQATSLPYFTWWCSHPVQESPRVSWPWWQGSGWVNQNLMLHTVHLDGEAVLSVVMRTIRCVGCANLEQWWQPLVLERVMENIFFPQELS